MADMNLKKKSHTHKKKKEKKGLKQLSDLPKRIVVEGGSDKPERPPGPKCLQA